MLYAARRACCVRLAKHLLTVAAYLKSTLIIRCNALFSLRRRMRQPDCSGRLQAGLPRLVWPQLMCLCKILKVSNMHRVLQKCPFHVAKVPFLRCRNGLFALQNGRFNDSLAYGPDSRALCRALRYAWPPLVGRAPLTPRLAMDTLGAHVGGARLCRLKKQILFLNIR